MQKRIYQSMHKTDAKNEAKGQTDFAVAKLEELHEEQKGKIKIYFAFWLHQ